MQRNTTAPTATTAADPAPPEALTRDLAALLAGVRRQTGVPGIAAAVSLRGRRFRAAVGWSPRPGARPAEPRPRFDTGCVAKLLLAIVAHELAAKRILELGTPIGAFLPELEGSRHGREIRVAHLLSHTSGYQGLDMAEPDTRALTWPSFARHLRAARRFFRPGTVFSYEHTETAILSRVLERATGESAERLIEGLLLSPLDIDAAAYAGRAPDAPHAGRHVLDPATRAFVPAGAAELNAFWRTVFPHTSLTLDELLDVADAVVRDDHPLRPRFPSAATLRALRRPAVRLPDSIGGPLAELMPVAFATGAAILRGGILANSGMSHGQCLGLRMDPKRGMSIAVGVNATLPQLRDLVLTRIQEHLIGAAEPHPRRLGVDLPALAGVYDGHGRNRVRASLAGERLLLAIESPRAPAPLVAELGLDARGALELRSPVPQLAVGVIDDGDDPAAGLMVGLTAYRRVEPRDGAG